MQPIILTTLFLLYLIQAMFNFFCGLLKSSQDQSDQRISPKAKKLLEQLEQEILSSKNSKNITKEQVQKQLGQYLLTLKIMQTSQILGLTQNKYQKKIKTQIQSPQKPLKKDKKLGSKKFQEQQNTFQYDYQTTKIQEVFQKLQKQKKISSQLAQQYKGIKLNIQRYFEQTFSSESSGLKKNDNIIDRVQFLIANSKRCEQLAAKNVELNQELSKMDVMQQKMQDCYLQINKLNNKLLQNQTKFNSSLSRQVKQKNVLKQEIQNFKKKLEQTQKRVSQEAGNQQKDLLKQKDMKIQAIQSQNKGLKQQIVKSKQIQRNLENECERLRDELDQLKQENGKFNQSERNLQNECERLRDELDQLKQENGKFNQSERNLQNECERLRDELDQLKQENGKFNQSERNLQNECERLRDELDQLKQENGKFNQSERNLQNECERLKDEIDNANKRNEVSQLSLRQQRTRVRQGQQSIKRLEDTNQQLNRQFEQVKNQKVQKQQALLVSKKQCHESNLQLQIIKSKYDTQRCQLDAAQKELINNQNIVKFAIQSLNSLSLKIYQLNKNSKPQSFKIQHSKQQEIRRLIENINQRYKEAYEAHEELKLQCSKDIQEKTKKVEQLQSQIKQQQEIYKKQQIKLRNQLKDKQKQIDSLSKQRYQLRRENDKLNAIKEEIKNSKLGMFFNNDVLSQETVMKSFIIDSLQKEVGKRVKKTYLLYKYDRLSKVNFHQYIDGHSNLLLLVKTKQGRFIGGFTQDMLQKQHIATKKGLLMSLSPKQGQSKYFKQVPKTKIKSVAYDQYSVIFGSNQLRLKSNDIKEIIESKVGTLNRYFDTDRQNVNTLFGMQLGTQSSLIDTYEFYRIDFQQRQL